MRSSFVVLASLVAILCASGAHAQCAFDAPAKARGLKSDLVRAYSACPGATFAAPNTVTMAGVPACGAPVAPSTYSFGAKGTCKLQISQKAERPCSNGCGLDCANTAFKARCKDVLDAGGIPIEAAAWTLNIVMRATMDDASGGDMTLIDFPVQLPFGEPKRGRLRLRYNSADLFGIGSCFDFSPLPPCTHIELLSVYIVDPHGDIFASLGSSTR